MEPRIIEKEEIILVGMIFYGDPFKSTGGWSEENEIGKLWKRFSTYWDKHGELLKNVVDPNVGYKVHIEPEEYAETKNFYVMVAVKVAKIEALPLELSIKVLPPSTYALFTLRGKEITSNWPDEVYQKWLPESGYKEAHKFTIECYDGERFKGMDNPESELDVYVPIKRKTK